MTDTSRALVRLGIGAAQGAGLALLWLANRHGAFPATVPQVYAPLLAVALFVPLLMSQALGNVRRSTLLIWGVVATALAAGLTWYDVWHGWPSGVGNLPSPRIIVILAMFLFVAHALVSCGDADRRVVARYPTLFDLAWKLGVQFAITLCFVTAFWVMLWLGIALFNMIGFTGFGRFITGELVAIPLTTIAAAAALHATDLSAPLVRGVRTLALTLLSWLLPVIALIALAFLVSLAVTGLQPLWATRTAAFLLIAAVAVLVIHINAAYQDGAATPPHILRVAGTLAAVLLVFLTWIAAYALWLRVMQYGWTVDRVTSAACVAVAAMFAAGYLIAAVLPGSWLHFIERWNVYGTFFFLIVVFALATPIADPMRLAVDSQVARLKSGAVKPEKFDFHYLARQGGRFGHQALAELAKSPNMKIAALALAPSKKLSLESMLPHFTPADITSRITMHPAGKALPESFVKQDWSNLKYPAIGGLYSCVEARSDYFRCDAAAIDIDGDGVTELVVIGTQMFNQRPAGWSAWVYRVKDGHWQAVAEIPDQGCGDAREALLAGRFELVEPSFKDVRVGTRILHLVPGQVRDDGCNRDIGFVAEPLRTYE